MSGDARQGIEPRAGVDGRQPDVAGRHAQRAGDGQGEGGLPELDRVDAEREMMHDRIADERDLHDIRRIDAAGRGDLQRQRVERRAHRDRHLPGAVRVHHRVADPAHEVLAEADLRVHDPGGRHDAPVGQVAQVRRDGGRAEIDGETHQRRGAQARPDVEDPPVLVERDGHLPAAGPQHALELA